LRYFTSDQHFFDSDIISYSGRPFESPDEMNEAIAQRFSETVRDASEVYIIGDLLGSYRPEFPLDACAFMMERLEIRKFPCHLILGNHDTFPEEEYLSMGFATVKNLDFIEIRGDRVMLTHDPCMVQMENQIAICGHIHTLFSEIWSPMRNTFTVNVSVEARDYRPISEDEFASLLASSQYRRD
jgi:calcineurin-like phosphoesterase family protein